MISDQPIRDRVTHDHETLFAVDAGAGTGKTTLLVSRIIALLTEKEARLSRIAAITFTEKAAAELAERLRSKLEESLAKHTDQKALILQALEDMEKAPISTIHSFCAGLLREYPVEAGVDPQFTLLDEVQSRAFEAQAWEHWLKTSLSKPVEPLFHFQRLGGAFEHLEELKQFLKRNRTLLTLESAKPLPSMEPLRDQIRAFVALTKKEAAQCAKPDDSLLKTLEGFWAGWEAVANLPAEDLGFELANFKIPKVGNKGAQGNWGKERLAVLRDDFVKLAEDHQAAFAPFKDAVVLNLASWVWDYFAEWDEQKAKGGFLDFDDLLLKTRDLLLKHPEVREELKDRFDYLFVDEFQDTDPLQVEIVFFLGEQSKKNEKDWKKVKLEPGKLFLVGDPKQSIYRFRRADVAIYEATKERILANGGQVEVLSENFRTVGTLVEWVNSLFVSQFEGTGIQYHPLTASRKAGATEGTLPLLWGLKIPKHPDEKPSKGSLRQWEAEWTSSFLKEILDGEFTVSDPKTHEKRPVRPGDIALLFRDLSNDVEEAWEEALRRRGLSYQIVGGKRFYNRPEIVALSTLLNCLGSPADEANLVALLRSPIFGFKDEDLFEFRQKGGVFNFLKNPETLAPEAKTMITQTKMGEAFGYLEDWYWETRELTPSETLIYLYEWTNLLAVTAGQPHGEQRVANLYKVLDQARELETSQHFTYRAFTQWLTTQQEEGTLEGEAPGPDSTEDRITLMTIHKAKGLEFPLVFVSAWAADPKDSGSLMDRKRAIGAFKVGSADLGLKTLNYDAVKEEEEVQRKAEDTRLLYVAATRARDCLLLPHFEFTADAKFKNENLFAGPLLKALEKSGAHWVEAKEDGGTLSDPSPWVVPLDEKPGPALEVEKEKLKNGRVARIEKIKALSGKRDFTTVTSLAHGDEEKNEKEERIFEEPEAASPWGGKGFGVLAHRLLEKGWDWDASLIEKAALAWAPLEGLTPEAAKEAAQMALKALSHPILVRARKSSRLLKELPLSLKQADGTYLKAVMDLVFQEGDEWVIVDYKSDRDPAAQAEGYRKQLEHYADMLGKATGLQVKEAGLYFLRQDGPGAFQKIK